MAIQEVTGPVLVTVYCDECEITCTADYLVPAGVDSLDTARHHMATNDGWMITRRLDICKECFAEIKTNNPGHAEDIETMERV